MMKQIMKETITMKKYITPAIKEITVEDDQTLLAASPLQSVDTGTTSTQTGEDGNEHHGGFDAKGNTFFEDEDNE
jgi:hypothetical protein